MRKIRLTKHHVIAVMGLRTVSGAAQAGSLRVHNRVHRVYSLLKLNFHRKEKQRLPTRSPVPLATCMMRWSAVVVSGSLM